MKVLRKNIEAEIAATEARINDISQAAWRDPAFVAANQARQREHARVRDKLRADLRPHEATLKDLRQQLLDYRDSKKKAQPERVERFLSAIQTGADWSCRKEDFLLRWTSKDGRFAIITKPGRKFWHGIGLQSYGPADHWLIDLDRLEEAMKGKYNHGSNVKRACLVTEIEGGRLTREGKAKLIERAEAEAKK